jgi:hypothetical protein
MRRTLVITFCGLGLVLPTGALASGGPVPPVQGGEGVAVPGGSDTFIARDAGADTVVERVSRSSGVVASSRTIPGHYGIPGAALDGSVTGLSADGQTLVLAEITRIYPAASTRLLVLDGARLVPRAPIVLAGAFTVDAVSPDGRWLYLIHYRSPRSADYEVRAYDLQQRSLVAKPVVDPREPDEKMQGIAATRIMSPDGRWAYTLYDRSPNAPYIHALDTRNLAAVCIDLPSLARSAGVFDMRLSLRGGSLNVMSSDTPVAVVNTRTFAVHVPGAVAPAGPARTRAPSHASDEDGGGGFPWELAALPLAAALVTLAVVTRRRRNMGSMAV